MPRNGNGGYSLLNNSWNPAINGAAATAADWQNLINDVAAAIQQSVSNDGQTPMVGSLNMGGFVITGLGAPIGTGQSLRWEQLIKGADIASAAIISIPNEGSVFDVTGTTGITTLDGAYPGRLVWLRFTGSVLLTNSTSLVLPRGANLVAAYGDVLPFICVQAGIWKCPFSPFEHGQCQTRYLSTTDARLYPYGGNGLIIQGRQYRIPQTGLSISRAGLSSGVTYYIYAKDDGAGNPVLESQLAGSAPHSTGVDGVEIKTGDPSRSLVGMFWLGAGNFFLYTNSFKYLSSWFNRRPVAVINSGFSQSTGSTTPVAVTGDIGILSWAGDLLTGDYRGAASNTSVSAVASYLNLNGSSSFSASAICRNSGDPYAIPNRIDLALVSDGPATCSVYGSTTTGTATFSGSYSLTGTI